MKAVIFSGGPGTRFWPVSRTLKSKTVAKTFNNKSFLELTVERLGEVVGFENVYIATGENHKQFLKEQVPQIKEDNYILEPVYKDTGPAVLNAAYFLNKISPNEPFGVFWSDHLIKDQATFKRGLELAGEITIRENKLVYYETHIRFPDVNLGHVKTKKILEDYDGNIKLHEFETFLEKPSREKAQEFFFNRECYFWNTGYLISTPKLLLDKFKKYAPQLNDLWEKLQTKEAFEKCEKNSLDYILAEKLSSNDCLVLTANMGWYDVGEWVMVKEAFEKGGDDNVSIHSQVEFIDSKNSLVYGQNNKLVALIGIEGVGVIDTPDALLVLNLKDSNKVKALVNTLKEKGLEKYV